MIIAFLRKEIGLLPPARELMCYRKDGSGRGAGKVMLAFKLSLGKSHLNEMLLQGA